MSKIYETPKDFEHDKLNDQSLRLHLQAEQQAHSGFAWMVISTIPHVFKEPPRWLSWSASVAGIVGLVNVVRSWFTHSKAHDLELQRDRLGPQTVILPPGVGDVATEPPCGCGKKNFSQAVGTKSHAQYAEHPEMPLGKM